MSDRNYSAEYLGYTLFWPIRLRPNPLYTSTVRHFSIHAITNSWQCTLREFFISYTVPPLFLLSELQYDGHRSRRCLKVVEGVILAQTVVTTTRWLLMVSNSQVNYRYLSRWCVLRCSAMPRYARNCSMAGSSLSAR